MSCIFDTITVFNHEQLLNGAGDQCKGQIVRTPDNRFLAVTPESMERWEQVNKACARLDEELRKVGMCIDHQGELSTPNVWGDLTIHVRRLLDGAPV